MKSSVGRRRCARTPTQDLSRPGEPARRDRGFTLPEVLITIVLMGTVLLAVLAAVQTNIVASSTSRAAARAESVIVNVADRVNRAPKVCDYKIYAEAAVMTEGWDPSTVSIQQWRYVYSGYHDGSVPESGWASGACAVGLTAAPELLVQKVSISVTTPDGKVTRTIELVKSDV